MSRSDLQSLEICQVGVDSATTAQFGREGSSGRIPLSFPALEGKYNVPDLPFDNALSKNGEELGGLYFPGQAGEAGKKVFEIIRSLTARLIEKAPKCICIFFSVLKDIKYSDYYSTIVLKVRLILGRCTFLVGGRRCNQYRWVVPFITNREPCAKIKSTFCLVSLCLKANFRSAPKVSEAIAPFFLRSFSPSECQAMPSEPS